MGAAICEILRVMRPLFAMSAWSAQNETIGGDDGEEFPFAVTGSGDMQPFSGCTR